MEDINGDFTLMCQDIDPKEMDEINDYYAEEHRSVLSRYGPKGYVLPANSSAFLTKIKRMQLRATDIFVTSFIKSGTTWTQELVWLIQNNLNFEKAASVSLQERFAFLEIPMFFSQETRDSLSKYENIHKGIEIMFPSKMTDIEAIPSPRFIKTHLPMSLLPSQILETCKVVYIARDPRDVMVSFYYYTLLENSRAENKTLKDMWNQLIKHQVPGSPYFEHVKEALNLKSHPNFLFLFYEELSKDLPAAVRRVASFLGKQLSQDEIVRLCEYLDFKNFKKNASVNFEEVKKCGLFNENGNFMRKGIVGDWIEHFDEEMKEQAERWISENTRGTNLRFPC